METPTNTSTKLFAYKILLQGRVQGLGIRPLIARIARNIGLTGWVCNSNEGVLIEIAGTVEQIAMFRHRLQGDLPTNVRLTVTSISFLFLPLTGEFLIKSSQNQGSVAAIVPTDQRVCCECLSEITDPSNRRFHDPFATCTQCGPRYSLVQSMPYDRQQTSMSSFSMCVDCQREYESPDNRRFHSQTNSCPQCGPRVWIQNAVNEVVANDSHAIRVACVALRDGLIVGIRGIGGYQWMIDASQSNAVSRLRAIKQRPVKPLAVMVADLAAAEAIADIDPQGKVALASPSNPIVVCKRRVSSNVAPETYGGLATIGVMLPPTAMHSLIAHKVNTPLVVTSGNLEDDPIPFELGESRQCAISAKADLTLEHNRTIYRPIDDSVVQTIAGRIASLRLGRGFAPLPLEFPSFESNSAFFNHPKVTSDSILAVGGHQKSAIALSNGSQAILGPHLGDLDFEHCRHRFESQIHAMCELYQMKPSLIVHDLHPDYYSTRWAIGRETPTLAVQHHHAHVVSTMLQEQWLDRTVLGVAWDGTGHGTDGTIWGGEFLITRIDQFERVASLLPFQLIGGEAAIHQPWRVAVALTYQAAGAGVARKLTFSDVSQIEINRVVDLLDNQVHQHGVSTSSAGRLFDGIAALVLGITRCRHEGQPAVMLEAACDETQAESYSFRWLKRSPHVLDWRPLINTILDDIAKGHSSGAIAMRFHRSMALAVIDIWRLFPDLPVALSGGCFQNRLLVELIAQSATDFSQPLATPGVIPAGDGGLAAGQLAIGIDHCLKHDVHRDSKPCV